MSVIFATTASYPGQFALFELPEEAWNQVRIFPTSLTGDVTFEIAENDWEWTRLLQQSLQIASYETTRQVSQFLPKLSDRTRPENFKGIVQRYRE